jgi:hypothetical protein
MYARAPTMLEPPPDARLAPDWVLCGYIVGLDAIFRSSTPAATAGRVCYGYVAESVSQPGKFALAIRGTADPIEWAEDGEFFQVATKWPGKVEGGFWGIFGSFTFRHPGGIEEPLNSALVALIGEGSLIIVGHSLGSALATMVAYEAAPLIGARVALRVFASPHPGDAEFVAAVAAAVPDHVHYANVLDLVPRVPLGFGYAALPNTVEISPHTAGVRIKFGPQCLHHLVCYLALIDPDGDGFTHLIEPVDQQNAACIVRVSAATARLAPP